MSDAVLFCNEGGQHVKRASSRVSQPPGGKTSFNIFGGDEAPPPAPARDQQQAPPMQQPSQQQHQQAPFAGQPEPQVGQVGGRKVQKEVAGKVGQSQQQGYNALFCNEGDQVRTRPARKIVQPPGGASSIFG